MSAADLESQKLADHRRRTIPAVGCQRILLTSDAWQGRLEREGPMVLLEAELGQTHRPREPRSYQIGRACGSRLHCPIEEERLPAMEDPPSLAAPASSRETARPQSSGVGHSGI